MTTIMTRFRNRGGQIDSTSQLRFAGLWSSSVKNRAKTEIGESLKSLFPGGLSRSLARALSIYACVVSTYTVYGRDTLLNNRPLPRCLGVKDTREIHHNYSGLGTQTKEVVFFKLIFL